MNTILQTPAPTDRLWQTAWWLSLLTIGYNIVEGLVAVWQGWADESLTLFGFGVDSFVEVASASGVAYLVYQSQRHGATRRSVFERRALRITGWGFYALTAGLLLSAIYNVYTLHRPDTTRWGILIPLISVAVMWALIRAKERTGRALGSDALLADAACARVCLYMSGVLLLSSGVYAVTGFIFADSIGAVGLAWFSWREGRESFEKAAGATCSCDCHH